MYKKALYFISVTMLILACAKNTTKNTDISVDDAGLITGDSLMKIAMSLPTKYSDDKQTKSTSKQIKEIVPFSRYSAKPKTKSATDDELENVYNSTNKKLIQKCALGVADAVGTAYGLNGSSSNSDKVMEGLKKWDIRMMEGIVMNLTVL